ncbi:MAG TPA: vWA domain-containing protein, partial [Polyangiaceae bacterium]
MSFGARRALGIALALAAGVGFAGCAASATSSDITRDTSSEAGSSDVPAQAGTDDNGGAPDTSSTGGKGGASDIDTNATAGAGAPDEACAAEVSTAHVVPLDMYIMMDTSLSMNDITETGIVKWDAVKTALESFLKDDSSAGLGVGIQYFPQNKPNIPVACASNDECGAASPCVTKFCYGLDVIAPCLGNADCDQGVFGPPPDCEPYAVCSGQPYECKGIGSKQFCTFDDGGQPVNFGTCTQVTDAQTLTSKGLGWCVNTARCDSAAYAAPDQPIRLLPDAAPALIASIDAQKPIGNTPTAPALTGALSQASAWATAHPDHQVIALMITDGLPSQCGPTAIADVSKIASDGLAATPSIQTFVVGVFGTQDIGAGAGSNLSKIASAGGTDSAFIVYTNDDVSAQLLTALGTIRSKQLSCEYQIPEPGPGQTLDYSQLNLSFKTAKKASTLYYVANAADCDPLSGGWYYNADPEL